MIFQYSALSIVFFFAIGASGHVFDGYESRFDGRDYRQTARYSPKRETCHTKGVNYVIPDKSCRYFDKNITWAAFGDSHIVEPAHALAERIRDSGEGLAHLTFSSCPPALLFDVDIPGCTRWINESLTFLENDQDIKNVLLGFRYSAFLFGDQLDSYPDLPEQNPGEHFNALSHLLTPDEARESYWNSFSAMVERLLASGKRVYVLYPVPELPVHI